MKKIVLTLLGSTFILAGCNSGTGTSSTGVTTNKAPTVAAANGLIKASYVDLTALTAVQLIPNDAYKGLSIVVFGFVDPKTTTIDTVYQPLIDNAIANETSGTVNLLGIGGQTATADYFNNDNVSVIINNVSNQIADYNSKHKTKIDGVDLDLENGIDGNVIAKLAEGFKAKGYKISVAPQVYYSGSANIDSANPSNMILTSGSNGSDITNNYQPVLNSGNVDYLFVQTYNTPGFTIDGVDEGNIDFFKNTAKALNKRVKGTCSGNDLCIPNSTKMIIATVANKYAGNYTIFKDNASPSDHQNSLNKLKSDIDEMTNDFAYSNFAGVMDWSMNIDYAADKYDPQHNTAFVYSGFNNTIYGANIQPPQPLKISITNATQKYYGAAVMVVNGGYYQFNTGTQPAGFGTINWGNEQAFERDPSLKLYNNFALMFGGTSSVNAQVFLRFYKTNDPDAQPVSEAVCSQLGSLAGTYEFKTGHSYSIYYDYLDTKPYDPFNQYCTITDNGEIK